MRNPNLQAIGVPLTKTGGKDAMARSKPGDTNLGRLSRAQGYKLRGKGGPAGKAGK